METVEPQEDTYYSRQRAWPKHFNIKSDCKVLDIGCGTGVLGAFFIDEYNADVTGIEILEECAEKAKKTLNQVYCKNIEEDDFLHELKDFDYVIFSDSLEHLVDPEKVLRNIHKVLKKSKSNILISVPNVRNFRVLIPLIFKGDWKYEDEGLLDRTHLRFFTRKSIFRTLDTTGYQVQNVAVHLPRNSISGIVNFVTLGLFEGFLTSHYYVQAYPKKS